jgi:two-component system sensor histidine kinase KdpD
MVYLFGVLVAAAACGRGPSVLASVLAVATLDFAFVPPRLTLAISDTQYLITFAVMLLVALLTSTLVVRVREQAESAREREHLTGALYAMTRETALMTSRISRRAAGTCATPSERGALLPDAAGRVKVAAEDKSLRGRPERPRRPWCTTGQMAGRERGTLPGARALYLPLRAAQGKVGVLGLRAESEGVMAAKQLYLLETFANQFALALERRRILAETQQAKLQAETERLRSALLSSVSHDLRTPLSVITGAASSLIEDRAALDEETKRDLTRSIWEEAERLNKLIGNPSSRHASRRETSRCGRNGSTSRRWSDRPWRGSGRR